MAAATIADRQHDHAKVLELVGSTMNEAPSSTMRRSILCAEARISALEDLGRANDALAELKASITELGPDVVTQLLTTKSAPRTIQRYTSSSRVLIGVAAVVLIVIAISIWRSC